MQWKPKPKFKEGDTVSCIPLESEGVVVSITPIFGGMGPSGRWFIPEYLIRWTKGMSGEFRMYQSSLSPIQE